tara:strand:- start:1121 stop:3043 length:1923 start_codon:yes stop_codon:yes gene_type:complete
MASVQNSVRDSLPIKLGERTYNVDLPRMGRSTIDPIRQGFDTQGSPGEQSLNQAGVWKRTRNDWQLGAGQRDGDTPESGPRQYYKSTGVNPWVKNELTLLKDTNLTITDSGTNLYMAFAMVGTQEYGYVCTGSDVKPTDDSFTTTETAIPNPAGGAIIGIASDGTNVYVASTAGNKVQKISALAVTGASANTDYWTLTNVDGVWVANGYLLASVADRLTVLSVGTAPSTNADIASSSFNQVDSWETVVGTSVGIFAGGNQGGQGKIYYIGINDSTAALNVPVIAAELPQGEKILSMAEYLGYVVLGTNKGFRLASITGQGYLSYGPRVNITNGVQVFEPQGEHIWFGWKDYESPFDPTTARGGLGRIGLSEWTDQLVPAYASDLMASGSGTDAAVQGVATFTRNDIEIRAFSISGKGVYVEHATNYMATGSIEEGKFRWGVSELKVAASVDLRHKALASGQSIAIKIDSDDGNTGTVTSNTEDSLTPGIQPILTSTETNIDGEYLIPTITLNTTTVTATPTLYRWTLRAIPMPFVAEVLTLPVILTNHTRYDERDVYQDVYDEYAYIKSLLESRTLVKFKMGAEEKTVYVSGVGYEPGSISKWSDAAQHHNPYERYRWVDGVLTVQLITVQTGVTTYRAS